VKPDSGQAVDVVAEVLQDYARRGVFQGCQAVPGRNYKTAFHFGWAYHQPYTLTCNPQQGKLVFVDLLPRIVNNSLIHREIKAFLKERSSPMLPEHRRVDPLRVTVKSRLVDGVLSLEMTIADGDYNYATTKLINLVHELFLFLNEHWADYMWENFQVSME
jgi:hypothetical protein